jgi:hypothetical protein
MAEWEYYCIGCKASHLASVWYRWIGLKDEHHSQRWLCGNRHAELPEKFAACWEPYHGY